MKQKSPINTFVPKIFATHVFTEDIMKQRLPEHIFLKVKNTLEKGHLLDQESAEYIAKAMKEWAIERGATHFTHWFQPMNGITAEKHESFIENAGPGHVIMEFSGKELIQGESDASSFPSGGIRSTFEARGYTVWDATSPAFLREDLTGVTLYIPTAFYSYNGEALDKKTPLLRSMQALSKQTLRILRTFGDTETERVYASVGAEQEYFLIDKHYYTMRTDLQFTGRTLFGAPPPKGQEMEDHYYGSIKERISDFMRQVDIELWKLGISAKTKHHEVAPGQYELALIHNNCNLSTDHNQLLMDTITKIAERNNLVCLLHAKPFQGVNGSGKHNNWSIITDKGINLLEPGKTSQEKLRFLLFLSAILKAVDCHADLLRFAAATPDNDERLGHHEAPPVIISVFLGDFLTSVFDSLENGSRVSPTLSKTLHGGVNTLPPVLKDNTDRNRTSPFAFTGNKFEFRMVSSQASLARPNIVLNTIVADVLDEFATLLEKAKDPLKKAHELIRETYKAHKRIVFNGNGYSDAWREEAKQRGLPEFISALDVYPELITEKNITLFARQKVFNLAELKARAEIYVDMFMRHLFIEANTMIRMTHTQLLPAVFEYQKNILALIKVQRETDFLQQEEKIYAKNYQQHVLELMKHLDSLESAMAINVPCTLENVTTCQKNRDNIRRAMNHLRKEADWLECHTSKHIWPFPGYEEVLYKI
ncbi:MAG: glutamine synthetase III [Candidatus Marinimicrobia bacterium]|nr:glutamine synthetase III [Candidatus Neomarinimicrobiota bacterium]